ncbi:lipoyl synthase [Candidatus Woesearchaeota archaeon]|nr:lipoyl synthase [Candidatus Woesearchaeota archaeon]
MNIPDYIQIQKYNRRDFLNTREKILKQKINTVCFDANCPNRYECFSKNTATFIILGNTCTRNCKYCNVNSGIPDDVDINEPNKIKEFAKNLGIKYAVITCVTRDDLDDCGASQFVKCVNELNKENIKTEVLISDLNGNFNALKKIIDSKPAIIGHNIETVERLFGELRPKANYLQSLNILKEIKKINPQMLTKSGIIVGLGETITEIKKTITDLKNVNCDFLSIGQYLSPSENHYPVQKYYSLDEFEELRKFSHSLGFTHVESGPLVRSSYNASRYLENEIN